MATPQTFPTYGYDDEGNGQIFHLAKGEKLPKGFHDRPPKGTHPSEREAAAARAALKGK